MKLYQRVRAVGRIFNDLEKETVKFKAQTGLSCLPLCGFCCTRPNVMASPVEFLPFAWSLYKEQRAEIFLDGLDQDDGAQCPLFRVIKAGEQKGFCGHYQSRGLVCRLFGFAAMINKHGQPELSTCKLIKEDQPEKYQHASRALKEGLKVPVYKDYYQRLANIEPGGKVELIGVNGAIRKALEMVLWDRQYRRRAG
ncbi:MAG: YkgJ family cysteine cluster protein [Cyclobacteriaceae bacterium]|nr:YkgJ family cysteine cluster protein [Cyclobacteriaceae bacterium]